MASDEMTEHYGYSTTLKLLLHPQPPTAILTASMLAAIGVRRAIQERGLTMGRDISVITHDDELSYLRNGQEEPLFTATRSSVRAAGFIVAQFLIDQIEGKAERPPTRLLEAELLVGGSTGPAPV